MIPLPRNRKEDEMTYEAPEVFELGDAEDLTLCGCSGLRLDICDLPRIFCRDPPSAEEMERNTP
jgi:hypothetical protein